VLTRDLERVIYTRLSPRRADFDLVRDLMLRQGLLERPIEFDEYVDVRFAEATAGLTPWRYRAGDAAAE
jgi:NitT/TauT family transport system substrate-binding protein